MARRTHNLDIDPQAVAVVFYISNREDNFGQPRPVATCPGHAEEYYLAHRAEVDEYECATGAWDHGAYDAVSCAVCGERLSRTR